jgi:hypothetical protein
VCHDLRRKSTADFFRFISWDVSTSEVCRDIDPRTDGIMLGMSLTADNRNVDRFDKFFFVVSSCYG